MLHIDLFEKVVSTFLNEYIVHFISKTRLGIGGLSYEVGIVPKVF